MKKVLVLGAGYVSGPLVQYLAETAGCALVVADVEEDKAQKLAAAHPRVDARRLDLEDEPGLARAIEAADIVVSLVPYAYHPKVARMCIARGKSVVTASYVSDAMKELDGAARSAGVAVLNEMGLDPGIDHMEAVRIIHDVKARGGRVEGFTSWCGGLPAPESNTNPFGYKFSWSPIGVLLAGTNDARFLRDGREVLIPARELFARPTAVPVEGLAVFDGYPNRNSLPYIDLYEIPATRTMLRGTLRYQGWCPTLKAMADVGLLDRTERDLTGLTYRDFMAGLIGCPVVADVREALAARLGIEANDPILERFSWLGLLDEAPLPRTPGAPLDVLAGLMIERLQYAPGERDMIVLRHTFEASYSGGRRETIVSSLVDFGIPGGFSSMARTVGYPAAIGARLLLEGRIKAAGVLIPTLPEIYEPVLEELAGLGIAFEETRP
jgi:saccharopine dehydrogenase-like NADP-dependent oxidoreductase